MIHSSLTPRLFISILILLLTTTACGGGGTAKRTNSGDPTAAVAHMQELSGESQTISRAMLEHIQASAHSKNPTLIENKRRTLIASVERAILSVNQVNAFNGDSDLKEATLTFLNTMYSVLREDYARLVDMEEVAEQSYDLMEAYLLARAKANEKLQEAAEDLRAEETRFAADNNVRLIENDDPVSKNLAKATKVLDYRTKIFLIHFKSYKQEFYLLEALNRRDVSGIEQNRETLEEYASEGLSQLSQIGAYAGDSSLLQSARDMLTFYRNEAAREVPVLTDFLLRQDQFESIKKAFEAKPPAQRTRADVDNFNAQVNQVNAAGTKSNATNERLNRERVAQINRWNQVNERFLSRHIPK
ncbi:MAG: hypothetical protein NXI24_05415 [bacterium]|nr:hypothetical protein [bacterium]